MSLRTVGSIYRMSSSSLNSGTGDKFEEAVKLLNDRRRQIRPNSGPSAYSGINELPETPSFKGTPSLFNMKTWLHALGYSDADLNKLNVIHVAGTKGKGSTCAFTRSFLETYGRRTGYPKKVGLYTSPHLKTVLERIQIDSKPLRKDLFAKYFFEVWNRLDSQELPQPRENIDVAIYETHNGGEYDATNVFTQPVATGITTIGMDHVLQLGPTLENIAWHKSGIFKSGAPAFSVSQEDQARVVLQRRAHEKNVSLDFVDDDTVNNSDVLALKTTIQRKNASLAQKLANAFIAQAKPLASDVLTPYDIREGSKHFGWFGRFQQVVDGKFRWFVDGAHCKMSVPYAAQWFAEIVEKDLGQRSAIPRVLVFSNISERDGATILQTLAKALRQSSVLIDHLIITTYEERLDGVGDIGRRTDISKRPFPQEMQKRYAQAWKEYQPDSEISVQLTVEGALDLARAADRGNGVYTLITGSLYLVGSALRLLEPA